jgi:hypothetical protein
LLMLLLPNAVQTGGNKYNSPSRFWRQRTYYNEHRCTRTAYVGIHVPCCTVSSNRYVNKIKIKQSSCHQVAFHSVQENPEQMLNILTQSAVFIILWLDI